MRLKINKTGSFKHSKKYIKLINEANVYDVSIKTPVTFATNMTAKTDNEVYLKREDLQPVFSFKNIVSTLLSIFNHVDTSVSSIIWNGWSHACARVFRDSIYDANMYDSCMANMVQKYSLVHITSDALGFSLYLQFFLSFRMI